MDTRVLMLAGLSASTLSCTATAPMPVPSAAVTPVVQGDAPGLPAPDAARNVASVPAPSVLAPSVPTPTDVVAPPALGPGAAPVAPPAAPSDAKFQLAAYRDGSLALRRLGDEVFVVGAAGLARLDARGRLVHVEYGLSGQDDPGPLFDSWDTRSLGGRWPDNAWLVTQYGASRDTSPPFLYRREGDRWRRQPNKDRLFYWFYEKIVDWRDDQVLGLRAYQFDPDLEVDDGPSPRLKRKIDAQLAAARQGFDLLGPTPTPAPMLLPSGVIPVEVAAAPGGDLFMLGHRSGDERSSVVQRWGIAGPAAIEGTLDTLPGIASCDRLVVRAADEVYVGCAPGPDGRPRLFRFDGATWSDEPAPEGSSMLALSVAPEGVLWAITGSLTPPDGSDEDFTINLLWRRTARGAAWESVSLPALRFAERAYPEWHFDVNAERPRLVPGDATAAETLYPVTPTQVLARAADDVWIVGQTPMRHNQVASYQTERNVVLRNRPVDAPLRMLPDGDLHLELLDWRPAPAWTADKPCRDEQPAFVALYSLPGDAARNQPEPALEAFVRDNQAALTSARGIYEVHRRGRRTVGLWVMPADQSVADALVATIQRAFPGERATLECRAPRIRREFDRTTGRALEAPPL